MTSIWCSVGTWTSYHSSSSYTLPKKNITDIVTVPDPDLVVQTRAFSATVSPGNHSDIRKIYQDAAASFLYMFLSLGNQSLPACQHILRTTIPLSTGLGYTGSVGVCLATPLLLQLRSLSGPHPNQRPEEARVHLERIRRWEYVYELFTHENPSGVDSAVSTTGGVIIFQRLNRGNTPPFLRCLFCIPKRPLMLTATRAPSLVIREKRKLRRLY